MNIPTNLKYTKSHEWILFSDDSTAKIGITDYAQNALGGIVFLSLPAVGDEITMNDSIGDVESIKSVSDIISPATGVVSSVNEALLDLPEGINENPYESWMMEISSITATDELLDAAAYEDFCIQEG